MMDDPRSWEDSEEEFDADYWDVMCEGCLGDCVGCRKYAAPDGCGDEDDFSEEEGDGDD